MEDAVLDAGLGAVTVTVVPHRTARALLAPALVAASLGPGERATTGVPASGTTVGRGRRSFQVVSCHERASQYGGLPHPPLLVKLRPGAGRGGATRPTTR
ncbi:hypothetical protein NOCARDAX2BIS_400143 [Nocardioides sp. AX2bis]|nr:hypothetical protein NOCARDAX2BIS_400143 [Nocardioides sp. AX2bis]